MSTPVCIDLFCGRFGWSRAFAARGWRCLGIDLVRPDDIPAECEFMQRDVLTITSLISPSWIALYGKPDFICASSPCEEFSVHGMKHFHPNPPYPEMGLRLFNHTRALCEASGLPYVMENVRAAQLFVGRAQHRCGPFYLWGNAVPPLMNQGIDKGMSQARARDANGKRIYAAPNDRMWSTRRKKVVATVPLELANCVAEYASRLLETA